MSREGIEPSTHDLKGRCSAIELPAHDLLAGGSRVIATSDDQDVIDRRLPVSETSDLAFSAIAGSAKTLNLQGLSTRWATNGLIVGFLRHCIPRMLKGAEINQLCLPFRNMVDQLLDIFASVPSSHRGRPSIPAAVTERQADKLAISV